MAMHISSKKTIISCYCCKGNHRLYKCTKFKESGIKQRLELTSKHALCPRCLVATHDMRKCNYKGTCNKCKENHNTLLHDEKKGSSLEAPSSTGNVLFNNNNQFQTLLSTVSIDITDANETPHKVRALLDSGSQINLLTDSLATKLQCSITPTLHQMNMLQGQSCISRKCTRFKIQSHTSPHRRSIQCVIVDNITQ